MPRVHLIEGNAVSHKAAGCTDRVTAGGSRNDGEVFEA